MKEKAKGIVYLIGAGPGDPYLITVKGKQCLQRADVVVYDYLVNELLLNLVREDAEIIYVGKKGGHHTMNQKEINTVLIEKACKGSMVARLKGGDPFIFGRGAEEAMELSQAGIPFEVIPGVTSAIAVPAYAGIPLTHRDFSSTTCFITGHEDPTKKESNIKWDSLAQSSGTLVFLMGIGNLEKIVKQLIDCGRPSDSPAAVISNGTTSSQLTVTGTLADIGKKVKDAKLTPPGVIVIGAVVNLREWLNWFESRPLFGKRIVVTRPEKQAVDFLSALRELGAHCVVFPSIKITSPESWGELDRALEDLSEYDWILFTSVNGVKYFFERLKESNKDARYLKGIKIGVIGPKTEAALLEEGIHPDLIPDTYWTEGVAKKIEGCSISGKRILIPRSKIARDYLPKKLNTLGALVDEVEAYQIMQPHYSQHELDELFKPEAIDLITFTSPSTITNFLSLFRNKPIYKEILKIEVACIGPVTAKKANEEGLKVAIVPDEYTVDSLIRAIVDFYGHQMSV